MKLENIIVPLTVPKNQQENYRNNYAKATKNSGRLFLFAGDQKVEHLNKDFYGPGISEESASPKHLFEIASQSRIGVFATHLGLIARYAQKDSSTSFVIKLNGKTDLVPTAQHDPISLNWTSVDQVVEFKQQTALDIVGVGMTIYLGSEHEASMLAAAAQMVYQAHKHGMLAILWMYPRGRAVTHEKNIDIVAGAAGVATTLGADFVKINPPEPTQANNSALLLKQATLAAGNTKVICSGGPLKSEIALLQDVYAQIHIGGCAGVAIGRNIHQKSLTDAIKLCNALAAIILDGLDVQTAEKLLK